METQTKMEQQQMENRQQNLHRRVQKKIAGEYLQHVDPGIVLL